MALDSESVRENVKRVLEEARLERNAKIMEGILLGSEHEAVKKAANLYEEMCRLARDEVPASPGTNKLQDRLTDLCDVLVTLSTLLEERK